MNYSDQSYAGFKIFEFAEGKVEEKRGEMWTNTTAGPVVLHKIFCFSFFWGCLDNILAIKIPSIMHLYFEKILQSLQIHHFCHKVCS